MADDQTIRELETTDDYLAQLISFLNNRVEALENAPESVSNHLADLQTMHENTLSTVLTWGTLFGIVVTAAIAIFIAIVGFQQFRIYQKDKEIEKLQKERLDKMLEMENNVLLAAKEYIDEKIDELESKASNDDL